MTTFYRISEIYNNVVQGEGPHAGYPCSVLRFSGCDLWPSKEKASITCPWCDTPNLHDSTEMDGLQIINRLNPTKEEANYKGLIITGGEPLMQLDDALLGLLASLYPWIDIETNGTVPFKLTKPENVFISCSPKTKHIVVNRVDWYKVLIPDKESLLESVILRADYENALVYVQPVEQGGYQSAVTQENIRKCLSICNRYGYIRLSLQIHKIIGVR